MDTSAKNNSGASDSWLFITKNNLNDDHLGTAGNSPESMKSSEEMEDSDGISVISESEMKLHTNSDGEQPHIPEEIEEEDENTETHDEIKNNEELDENLLTPPSTPNEFNEQEEEEDQMHETALKKYENVALKEADSSESTASTCHKSNHAVLLLIGMSLIIAVLYTNVSSLKNELSRTVSIYEQRIVRLEQENQILRTQLDELMRKLHKDEGSLVGNKVTYTKDKSAPPTPQKIQRQAAVEEEIYQKPPATKDVWLGGEKEEVVKVLDKKYNSLPDYCYFTDENDLFYEYNMENCEKKKQKMEERIKKREKFEKKETEHGSDNNIKYSVDDIWKSNDKTYNDFMSKTADEILQSLNDEIQEIKSSRFVADPMTNNVNDAKDDKLKFDNNFRHDNNNKKPFTKDKQNKQYANSEGSADNRKRKDRKQPEDDKSYNKQKKSKESKGSKEQGSGDWIDQRSRGREDARVKKRNDENWYLRRKNDREIHRLETTLRN